MSKGKQRMMMRVLSAFLAAGMSISISGMPVCASEAGSTTEQNEYVLEQAETEEKNADTAEEAVEVVETDSAGEAEAVESEPVSDAVSDETTDKTEEPAEPVSEESGDGRTDAEAAAELEAVAEEDAEEVTVHDEAAQTVAEETRLGKEYGFSIDDPYVHSPMVWISGSGQWRQNSRGWWYQYADGSYPKNQWVKINGSTYHFDASGYMQTGWQKIGGEWYYFAGGGAMATGSQRIGGTQHYFKSNGVWVDPNVVVQKVFAGFKERFTYVHLLDETYELIGSKEIVFIRRSQGDGVFTIEAEVTLETGLVSWVETQYINGDFVDTPYHFYISIP